MTVKNFDATRQAKELAADAEPWTGSGVTGPMQIRAMAQNAFRHDHGAYADQLTRDNCGACALLLMDRTKEEAKQARTHADGMPNYAGWLRVYIEAGKEVPGAWYVAEMTDAKERNPAYYNAILRSIKTFGIYIGKEG